jgi:hypothetical protein
MGYLVRMFQNPCLVLHVLHDKEWPHGQTFRFMGCAITMEGVTQPHEGLLP